MTADIPTAADLMRRAPVTIGQGASVHEALAAMRRRGVHEIPVLDGRTYRGMVSLDDIALRTNLALSTKVENLLSLPPRLAPEEPWGEVAAQLLRSGARAAPVIGPSELLLGLVSRSDVLRVLPSVGAPAELYAETVMGPMSESVDERSGIGTLIGLVRNDPPIAIVDRRGRLQGSVGIADLSRAFWRPKRAGRGDLPREGADRGQVLGVEARSIMRTPPVAVSPETSVRAVVAHMLRERVSSVFVVRDDRPIGVVTQTDLLALAVGGHPTRRPRDRVLVQLHGFPLREDPELVADVDAVVERGLSRIRRRLPIALLDLHLVPQGIHRAGHVTVSARLHTPQAILHAEQTSWDVRSGVAEVLSQLDRQGRALAERRRRYARIRVERRHARETAVLPSEPLVAP